MVSAEQSLQIKPAIWLVCGVVWLLVTLFLSLMPLPESGTGVNDKVSHLLAYFFLTNWFSLLIVRKPQLLSLAAMLLTYGVIIELLQGLSGYRSAEFADVVANLSGIAIGCVGYLLPVHQRLRNYLHG